MVFSVQLGIADIFGTWTPAVAATRSMSWRWVTGGAVGACRKEFHSSGVAAALIMAAARSGT